MSETYSPELVEKYLKELKKQFPDTDLHLLEMAVLQYIFLDCDKDYKKMIIMKIIIKQNYYIKQRI